MVIRQSGFRETKPNDNPMGNFALIPEGEYHVVVKKVEETESINSGNPMVKVRLMILDEGEYLGKLIFDQIVFCESMKGRNKHVLKVLEQPYEEAKGEEGFEIDPDEWIGKEARVAVIHEEYQGKPKAKVSQYLYKNEEAEKAAHVHKEKPGSASKPNPKPAPKRDAKPAPKADDDSEVVSEDDTEIPF